MFRWNWIKGTKAGKAMKEISEIWQPLYKDIDNWDELSDIGHFSPGTMKELKEAWAVVPKPIQKDLYKAYKMIKKHAPAIAVEVIKLFFKSQGITIA